MLSEASFASGPRRGEPELAGVGRAGWGAACVCGPAPRSLTGCRLEGGGRTEVARPWGQSSSPHPPPKPPGKERAGQCMQRTPLSSTCGAEEPEDADARGRVPGARQAVPQGWRESRSSGPRPQGHGLPWASARLKTFHRAAVGPGPPGCARRSLVAEPGRERRAQVRKTTSPTAGRGNPVEDAQPRD